MSSRSRRRFLWLAALPIVGVFLLRTATSRAGDPDWIRVELRELTDEIEVSGELRAVHSMDLGPPALRDLWNFKLSFMAPEGTLIEEGQPVLAFDTSELQPHLLEALAERDRTSTALRKATTDLEVARKTEELALVEAEGKERKATLKTTVPSEVVSSRELELARLDLLLAKEEIVFRKAQIEQINRRSEAELAGLRRQHQQAVSRVELIENQIGRMTMMAPRAGTVVYRTNWRGEKKKVGDNVWRQEIVLQIPDLDEMEVSAEVAEADTGNLELGQRASFRLDAHPEEIYQARVASIRSTIERRSWRDPRKVVRLTLELDRTDSERMRPGMRIKGKIEVARAEEVPMIPLDAVVLDAQGPRVTVKTGLGERTVRPRLKRRSGDWVEIESGLEPGDRVLRSP